MEALSKDEILKTYLIKYKLAIPTNKHFLIYKLYQCINITYNDVCYH